MLYFKQFKNGNGNPYMLQQSDSFVCSVEHISTSTEISHVTEPLPFAGHDKVKISFTARLSGDYSIKFNTSSGPIAGSPYTRIYLPGKS